MIRARIRRHFASALALIVIAALGLVAAAYTLVHQRFPIPFSNTYDINAELSAVDGVLPGLGQPVNVAGVQVGTITGARLANGMAILTLQLNRGQVPQIYANGSAALDPITPLGDIELNLSPGAAPAPALRSGGTLVVGQTSSPVQLEELLSNLDANTRTWLSSLIASLGQGTNGRAADLRQTLLSLGPSAGQLRQITAALATRRHELADLVHNVAILTRSASQSGQLTHVVVAGDQTLHAIAEQSVPLQRSVRLLPGTLAEVESTLVNLQTLSHKLGPALTSVLPATKRLPETLGSLRPFATVAASTLARSVRPLVVQAQPLIRDLAPATQSLNTMTPDLTSSFQALNYLVNEAAYNPGGRNQGYLYWLGWFAHNFNSVFSTADANGVNVRANILVDCSTLDSAGSLGLLLTQALAATKIC